MKHIRIHTFSKGTDEKNDDGGRLEGIYWAFHEEDGKRVSKYNGPFDDKEQAEQSAYDAYLKEN